MPDRIETRRALWVAAAVALLAFAVRAAHVLSYHRGGFPPFESPVLDAAFYDTWAKQILSGQWIGTTVFEGVPLYGYFLALVYAVFGEGAVPAALVQSALGAFGVCLLHLFTRKAFSEPVALVAAGLGCLYAPLVLYESFRLADALAAFFTSALLIGSWVALRGG